MISKGARITAEQKRWESTVREFGCVLFGNDQGEHGAIQIHHVVGLTAKKDGVLIGPWYILSLHWRLHDPRSSHSMNITNRRKDFLAKYGTEKELFLKMISDMREQGRTIPFGADVLSAIKNSHR